MANVDKHQLLQLLKRALAGDAGAWNDFFREIRLLLHAEVRRLLGPKAQGPLDHSALVQSALRRIWERIGQQFPDEPGDADVARFLAWIKTIVRNRSWDELRSPWHHRVESAGSAIGHLAERQPGGRVADRDRIAVEVAAAVARLPERQRQVVELFWFEGLSDADISARLGGSVGAIKVLRFRALRALRSPRLRDLLEDGHDDQC
jgi:RNA polymerase sigma-70 factor (ECF subfamily)